jgi:CBS domain-containing protein
MKVEALMTRSVQTVSPEASLAEAAKIMLDHHISGLPVVEADGKVVGMLTEADLLYRAELGTEPPPPGRLQTFLHPDRPALEYMRSHGRKVAELMTTNPITVSPATELSEVAVLLHDRHLKRLPVVENGTIVGIISRMDILRALAPTLADAPPLASDAAIKESIEQAVAKEKWARRLAVAISVQNGVVTLNGAVYSDAERQALRVAAENTPGVNSVVDDLTIVDPATGLVYPPY